MKYFKLILVIFLLFLFYCGEDPDSVIKNKVLVSATEQFVTPKNEIGNLFKAVKQLTGKLKYDVKVYNITYKTNCQGTDIIASGVVAFPQTDDAIPMMSFQRGTIVAHNEAPTQGSNYISVSYLASIGYIFILPDLIGFGSSTGTFHPYYNKDLTAIAVIDIIKATKELAREKGYNFNNQLFLSGYSEGGYATMATHHAIEKSPIESITLIASAPSSGGYDIKGMQEYFFGLTTYHQPYYLAFVAMSYISTKAISLPLSKMFNSPYDTRIADLFDGKSDGGQINGWLTTDVKTLIFERFLQGIDIDPIYKPLIEAFEANSLDDWIPKIKMIMYHGDADITVPYQNSVDSYNKMIAKGTSKEVLEIIALPGSTHRSGFVPYLESMLVRFDKMK